MSTLQSDSESRGNPPGAEDVEQKLESVTIKPKLHGRAFYESIGSPKHILAPMVDQSEFAWRMLTRSFLPPAQRSSILSYTPMLHARLFTETQKYRSSHFEPIRDILSSPSTSPYSSSSPFLDGNPSIDRPLIVQFCANDAQNLLEAAQYVAPYCDAVDLNLGCPQGIAKRGHYGAFLQEDWALIHALISRLHKNLSVPVTAKFRILETKEKTLEYARMILDAGASIITVHGRRREQKGHATGLADWSYIKYLRENLPDETVIFANGNVLQHQDMERCMKETGVDGIMSAEGNLCNPALFASEPAAGEEGREYWRGRDGRGGWRMDAVLRRYMDIIHKFVLEQEPPRRKPLFMVGDPEEVANGNETISNGDVLEKEEEHEGPPKKKQKREKKEKPTSPNLTAMQAHLFHMLRPLVSKQTHVRDALAKARAGDIAAFENVLSMVEEVTRKGLLEYDAEITTQQGAKGAAEDDKVEGEDKIVDDTISSKAAIERCKRPWFICQSYIRPLPAEALEKGSMSLSKKEKRKLEIDAAVTAQAGLTPEGSVEKVVPDNSRTPAIEAPREGLVCG